MNYTIFFAVMNLILISRLRLTLRDTGVRERKEYLIMGAIPLPLLAFFEPNYSAVLLAVYLILCPTLTRILETDPNHLNRNRFIMLLIHLLIVGLLTSRLYTLQPVSWLDSFEAMLIDLFSHANKSSSPQWLALHAILFGFLFILNEVNNIVRLMLFRLGLSPLGRKQKSPINEEQYRTGRIIGFLERIFVFLFILLQQYAAVGFILAAKGIVRYPDFGNRTFAEYILIGTLLSTLFAMMMAFLVKLFI